MSCYIIYIKANQSVCVNHRKVTISDIATVYCSEPEVMAEIKKIKLITFPNVKNDRKAISIMKVIEDLKKQYPEAEITNLGKEDILIYYKKPEKNRKWVTALKVTFVCLTVFFGAGISIMGYNNDVDLMSVFSKIYYLTTGVYKEGPSVMHLFYAVGLFIGMVVFFNHASKKRLSDEPTPVEVQMRIYESNVNNAIITGSSRKEEEMDVDG